MIINEGQCNFLKFFSNIKPEVLKAQTELAMSCTKTEGFIFASTTTNQAFSLGFFNR